MLHVLDSSRNLPKTKLIIFPGHGSANLDNPYYDSVYGAWSDIWKDTLTELEGEAKLYSDQFTRQDLIASIFVDDIPAGICCFRYADLSKKCDREDSWFKPWPEELKLSIGSERKRGLVVSWFTVHPDFRRTQGESGNQMFDIGMRLGEMIVFLCLDLKVDVGFGTTRNNRSVNKICAHGGGTTMGTTIHHGVEVNLMCYFPENMEQAKSDFPIMIYQLWKSRIDFMHEVNPSALPLVSRKRA